MSHDRVRIFADSKSVIAEHTFEGDGWSGSTNRRFETVEEANEWAGGFKGAEIEIEEVTNG